ncbi:hypothetical protein NDU88_001203 [Pleurodeles waltl]|uniref:Uncharacterized protein n=1 Tax=Pleurodeles waltl TaxID=8319 RepID=A0AAV7KNY0_PLEWA|nr:hypothetical protein NDU88_001203 [Pleurodeles waltl]
MRNVKIKRGLASLKASARTALKKAVIRLARTPGYPAGRSDARQGPRHLRTLRNAQTPLKGIKLKTSERRGSCTTKLE